MSAEVDHAFLRTIQAENIGINTTDISIDRETVIENVIDIVRLNVIDVMIENLMYFMNEIDLGIIILDVVRIVKGNLHLKIRIR